MPDGRRSQAARAIIYIVVWVNFADLKKARAPFSARQLPDLAKFLARQPGWVRRADGGCIGGAHHVHIQSPEDGGRCAAGEQIAQERCYADLMHRCQVVSTHAFVCQVALIGWRIGKRLIGNLVKMGGL